MRKLDSVSGDNPVQAQRKTERENNREADPQIRVIDKSGNFSNPPCREGHLLPMGTDGRGVYIWFYPKGK